MFKSFWQIALRFVALTALAIAVTFSNPLLALATSPEPSGPLPSEVSVPDRNTNKEKTVICPDDKSGNTKAETDVPCEPADNTKKPQPDSPYDMEAIRKFDRELYGD